jgi:hypothetical protein
MMAEVTPRLRQGLPAVQRDFAEELGVRLDQHRDIRASGCWSSLVSARLM